MYEIKKDGIVISEFYKEQQALDELYRMGALIRVENGNMDRHSNPYSTVLVKGITLELNMRTAYKNYRY